MIVLVPMAGTDAAFEKTGQPYSKNFIEIDNKPLLQHVCERLQCLPDASFVFVVRKEESLKYHVDDVLRLIAPNCAVVACEDNTAGAACTALLAIEHIDPDAELLIANGDQVIIADLARIIEQFRDQQLDGGTIVFDSVHPRWSYVRVNEDGLVEEASEKRPISRNATAGFYYYRKGRDFIESATSMIKKDASVNGLFYVCPTFNEMILRQAKIGTYSIDQHDYFSFATPKGVEQFEAFLARV